MSPHISIKGEVVYELFGFPITNTVILTVLVVIGFIFIAHYYYNQIHKKNRSLWFYALHSSVTMIYDLIHSVLLKKTNYFFPLLGSFFFFILLLNWAELIPGVGSILIEPPAHTVEVSEDLTVPQNESNSPIVKEDQIVLDQDGYAPAKQPKERMQEHTGTVAQTDKNAAGDEHADQERHLIPLLRGGSADLNTTLALALTSVFITQLFGFKFLGAKLHLSKYFNFKDPIMIFLGPLEIIQELARIISFAFRLYGNIFAGEVLLTIIPFLVPVFFSFIVTPIFFLEIFVGLVQALVFVMLSAVFISMATTEHH